MNIQLISFNKILLGLTITFFTLLVSNLFSQKSRYGLEEGQSGTIYTLAIPDTCGNTEDARHPTIYPDNVYFMIYSGVDQTLEMLKPNGGIEKVILKANKISKYEVITAGKVKGGNPQITIPNLPQANKLFVLRSEKPIVVYVMFDTRFGTEAWTPLPAESWGTDYYSVGVPGRAINNIFTAGETTYSTAPKIASGQLIVSTLDSNTQVKLDNPTYQDNIVIHKYEPIETNIKFTLQEGNVNLVKTFVDTLKSHLGYNQPDIGGIHITSNNPIGVISGNTRTLGGIADSSVDGAAKTTMLNMLIEAVAPIETHGKQFVYMPTWDSRRPTDVPPVKGKGGVRLREYGRFYGTTKNEKNNDDVTNIELTNSDSFGLSFRKRSVKLGQGTILETINGVNDLSVEFNPNEAYYLKADKPTQATKISTAVSYVVASSNIDGSGVYQTWAPFMVEMVPVEQWVTFAPGFTPLINTYENNLNICTDSSNKDDIEIVNENGTITKINFNRKIPGSPYVWTSVSLNSAMKFIVQSKSGIGKFYGEIYGTAVGSEQFQPGSTKKKDDDKNINQIHVIGKNKVLHPSDYYTSNAHSYGYPLAPNRLTLDHIDSIVLKVNQDCKSYNVNAKLIGLMGINSPGFRTIRSININKTKLVWNTPSKITSIIGLREVNFNILPIDKSTNVEDTIELISKSGQIWSIPFKYVAEKIVLNKYVVNFGKVKLGNSSSVEDIIVKSSQGNFVIIDSIQFKNKLGYEIVSLSNSLPFVISVNDSLIIKIKIQPTIDTMYLNDTLIIKSKCNNYFISLTSIKSNEPCISVENLNFGIINNQSFKELPLKIKNIGDGELLFIDQNGNGPIVWSESAFSISKLDQNLLLNSKIKSGDSIIVNVMFRSSRLGEFKTTAKIFTNALCQKDTTNWIGESSILKDLDETISNLKFSLFRNKPEPFTNETNINYYIQLRSRVKFEMYDHSGKLIKSIEEGVMESGEHNLILSGNDLNTGIYYLKMIVDNQSKSIKINFQK